MGKLDKCKLCGNFCNLEHILNWCKRTLEQGKTKWRHDSVLSHMVSEMIKGKEYIITIYADLPGHQINGGYIPSDILITAQRPYIVVIDINKKHITLFELSVSFEKNLDSANLKKATRYQNLTTDLTQRGWVTYKTPFEIGSRGYVN